MVDPSFLCKLYMTSSNKFFNFVRTRILSAIRHHDLFFFFHHKYEDGLNFPPPPPSKISHRQEVESFIVGTKQYWSRTMVEYWWKLNVITLLMESTSWSIYCTHLKLMALYSMDMNSWCSSTYIKTTLSISRTSTIYVDMRWSLKSGEVVNLLMGWCAIYFFMSACTHSYKATYT